MNQSTIESAKMIFPARSTNTLARSAMRRQRYFGCGIRYGGSSITNVEPSPLNTNVRSTQAATNAMTVPST